MAQLLGQITGHNAPASGAVFSPDSMYRYKLWRVWDASLDVLGWVMLNPSTADASLNDPTISHCMAHARSKGFGGIIVCNLYAYRTPYQKALWDAGKRGLDIVGPETDAYLRDMYLSAPSVVAAWGSTANPEHQDKARLLLRSASTYCLGLNLNGSPKHPLYVPAVQPLMPWNAATTVSRGCL